MANLAFDTHKYVKRLTAAGMPENQAEVIADEQRSLIEDQLATGYDIKELEAATRQDIAAVRRDIKELEAATQRDTAEIRRDIEELRAETKRDIAEVRRDIKELEERLSQRFDKRLIEMEHRLTLRLGGMMIAGFGVVAALIKLL